MTTSFQLFSAYLSAWLLTLAGAMALLLTLVKATSKQAPANLSTANLVKPTRLVLQHVLAAHACLRCQEGTIRTSNITLMTIVGCLRMRAWFRSFARESTGWWICSTRKWWLQDCSATIATDLLKDGFAAGPTCTFVAEFLTSVIGISALQLASTAARADMLCLEAVFRVSGDWSGIKWSKFAPAGLSLPGLSLAWTTSFSAFMSAAVERHTTHSHALRRFLCALMAYSR